MSANYRFFAPCPRGLEAALDEELTELGLATLSEVGGGVSFEGSFQDAYCANLHSRIASRVLCRISSGPYRTEDDIYRAALDQRWLDWFEPTQSLRVDVSASHCPLKSLEFATLRIKDGICDRMRKDTGRRPDIDTRAPEVRVFAYLDANTCTLYLDTSGEALFKRGWRLETGEAPLRENLAAGILRLAAWKPGTALLDPMCGSGTFAVEAAQMSLGIAPGMRRQFGFERLKNFDDALWQTIRSVPSVTENAVVPIQASDVSGDAVVMTRANLERAGVPENLAQQIAPKQIDARHIRPFAPSGILVVNPPYGERIGLRGTALPDEFFKELGDTLKQRFAGWQCYILAADLKFQGKLRLAPNRRIPLFNGAIECRLFRFDIVAGRAFRPTP